MPIILALKIGGIMAKLSTVIFTGKSGTEYSFNTYSWDTNFKEDHGAVYFITNRSKESGDGYNHKRIYVGQTNDLSSRFDNHHKQDCFDKYSANCICIYGEQDEDKRIEVEKDLIDNYNPPCNE